MPLVRMNSAIAARLSCREENFLLGRDMPILPSQRCLAHCGAIERGYGQFEIKWVSAYQTSAHSPSDGRNPTTIAVRSLGR